MKLNMILKSALSDWGFFLFNSKYYLLFFTTNNLYCLSLNKTVVDILNKKNSQLGSTIKA